MAQSTGTHEWKMLTAKEALEGLKSVDMGLSESCVMDKQKRVSFTKAVREPKKVWLEIVHRDVWDHLQFHHLVDQGTTSSSSMISVRMYEFTF